MRTKIFLQWVILSSLVSFSCCPSHIPHITAIKCLAVFWTHCAVPGTYASLHLGNSYLTSCITKHLACTRYSIILLSECIPKLNSNIISSGTPRQNKDSILYTSKIPWMCFWHSGSQSSIILPHSAIWQCLETVLVGTLAGYYWHSLGGGHGCC